jgi:hypothetical protein
MGGGMRGGGMMLGRGMGGMMGGPGKAGMMGGEGMMGSMMGGMGGGMMGAAENVGDWRSEAKKVMIRAFDFTAKEDETYRYRVRIVVYNPNKGREDVSAGVNTEVEELRGPWSEPTDAVSMPPDVMPYARGTMPPDPASDMKVQFQVIRFNPADGVTVPRPFWAAPGDVIGEPRTADIPVSDGSGKKSKTIDFTSNQILLDVFANKKTGGYQQLPPGFVGAPIVKPALALLLRPDGSVVLHNEADDEANDVRKDIDSNYKHELSQSTKKRENSAGAGMMGMMGMMGGRGMMGGGGGR